MAECKHLIEDYKHDLKTGKTIAVCKKCGKTRTVR